MTKKKRKVSIHEDSNPTPAAYNTATSFKAFSMVLTPANAVQNSSSRIKQETHLNSLKHLTVSLKTK